MSGHLLNRLVCLVLGHERVWQVEDRGGVWVCTRCLHAQLSKAVSVRRRQA